MENLSIIKQNGQLVVDSREVAQMTEREHNSLMRAIRGYIEVLDQSAILHSDDFFISSTYVNDNKQSYPCYLLTKKGCDMVANKMTGEKGILFTAAYVSKFEEMENQLRKPMSIEDLIIMQANSVKELRNKVQVIEENAANAQAKTEFIEHRLNNLDLTNIEGTPRQRLNSIIKKYGFDKGIDFRSAWNDFVKAFNTAYHTNLKRRKDTYISKNKLKTLSTPDYIERAGMIEDALRVADKLLNNHLS